MAHSKSNDIEPILSEFLSFLARDIQQYPDKIQPLKSNMRSSIETLISDVDIELERPLTKENN